MNLHGKDRTINAERDDKMSRKNDASNRKHIRFGEGESDDFREDFYQPSQQDEDEETIDISSFGLGYQSQQLEAQSDEAKKVAELMASISAENTAAKSEKGKKEKKKKDKKIKKEKKNRHGFGIFEADKDGENDAVQDRQTADFSDENIADEEYTDAPVEYMPEEQPEDTYYDEYSDGVDVTEPEPMVSDEPDDDYPLDADAPDEEEYGEEDYGEIEAEYDYVDETDDEPECYDEDIDSEEDSEYDEPDGEDDGYIEDNGQESEAEEEQDNACEPQEEEQEVDRPEKAAGKRGILQRLKAFWNGPEDFEEKFGEDFDPSVFDEEQPQQDTEDSKIDEEETEDEMNEPAEEAAEDEEQPEEVSEEEADEEAEATGEEEVKKPHSLFDKIKALWNGDDIKNKNFDEEVTEEDIQAEVEAERSEWIKSSVKYDDLSEYAPKQRDKVQEEEKDFDYDADYKVEGKGGIFSSLSDRVKSFLRPSLGAEEELPQDEEETEIEEEIPTDENTDEDDRPEEIKKNSPIEQIKKLWNEDDSYADEDDPGDEDDDDEPIDAQFVDEEKPVITKPVLTVISPSKYDGEDDDIYDEEQVQDEEETVDETAETDGETVELIDDEQPDEQADSENAPEDKTSDDFDDEDEIISEGPDKPIDVVASSTHRKGGLLGRLKSFWNGGSIKSKGKKDKAADEKDINEEAEQPEKAEQATKTEEKPQEAEERTEIEDNGEAVNAPEEIDEKEEQVVAAVSAQEAAAEIKAQPATFDEVAQNVQIDSVDGRQVVNGKVVPKYVHEDLVEKISLTNENLPFVVRREYEEYIRQAKYRPNLDSTDREVNSEVSKAVREEMNNPEKSAERLREKKDRDEQAKKSDDVQGKPNEPKQNRRSIKDLLFGDIENSADFSEFRAQTNLNPQNDQVIEDYDKPSDARAIRAEINYDNRKVSFRCITLAVIFLITLVFYIIQRYFPTVLTHNIPNADIMTCLISLILLIISAVLCHSTFIGGLKPLIAFKGNSDTAVAVAVVGCLAQGVVSFFEPQAFFSGGMHLYAILAIAALLFNNLGKLCIVRRIKDNFRFVSSPNRKYAARIYENEEVSQQMIDKTNAEKPVVALQSRTRFLKGFLKFSYMPDPSERAASFMAPLTTVIAVLVAIICGISSGTVGSAVSAFSIVACMGIPMCSLLAVNIPMRKLCQDSLKNRAMIIGYPAVKTFSETRAVMVDSRELYPRGKVQLLSVKTFNTYNIDKALLNAAAVMKIANTPMTYMFEDVISEKGEQLPEVESVKYEDGNGLVSWVGGERLLLGNRELMKKYSINLPSVDFEESSVESRSNCITYLANAGQLVAMLVTDYQADKRLAAELKRLEKNGVTILIRTADPNVSQLKVAKDFGVFIRSIKILPTTLGNICKDEMSRREESSRAFISTEGKLHSLARAISGCIKIRDNIMIAIVIQVIAVALGVLIAAAVSVFSGLNGLHGLDLLLYVIFWAAASIIAPLIQKA